MINRKQPDLFFLTIIFKTRLIFLIFILLWLCLWNFGFQQLWPFIKHMLKRRDGGIRRYELQFGAGSTAVHTEILSLAILVRSPLFAIELNISCKRLPRRNFWHQLPQLVLRRGSLSMSSPPLPRASLVAVSSACNSLASDMCPFQSLSSLEYCLVGGNFLEWSS